MQATETPSFIRRTAGLEILCAELPAFDASDLAAVQRAFRAVKSCPLRQVSQAKASPGFIPAAVRVGWREDRRLVFAESTDRDIFTNATALNQRLWELGDTFEIFLWPDGQTEYCEFHAGHFLNLAAPAGQLPPSSRVGRDPLPPGARQLNVL
jgi:hypothetical protein